MPTTVPTGFIYPDNNSEASINVAVAALAGSVEAKVGPYVVDTGWVEVSSLSSGITGNIRYRRVGKTAQVVGSGLAMSGGFPAKGITLVAPAGSIPAGVRPTFNIRGSGNGAGSATAILSVLSNGAVYVFNQHTGSVSSMDGAAMYITD